MIEKYNEIIRKKMIFIYGDNWEKKWRERRNTIIILPILGMIGACLFCLRGVNWVTSFSVALFATGMVLFIQEKNIFSNAKSKCGRMRMELSEVLDRTALLLEAGTSLWNALASVASTSTDKSDGLIFELKRTVARFYDENGYIYDPETAFEDLAERCEDPYISTFVSLVVQNARKGTSELADLMRMQAINARNERRILAKQLPDEATTLMLVPSGMVLIAILALAAAPAILQLI